MVITGNYKSLGISETKALVVDSFPGSVSLQIVITIESDGPRFQMDNVAVMLAMILNSGMDTVSLRAALEAA